LETIADSRALSMIDQPDCLAELVSDFAAPGQGWQESSREVASRT
jgi:hypothetical protein